MSTESSSLKAGKPIVIDGISYIPSSALLTGIQKISFKDNRAFAVVDPQGEAPRLYSGNSELGFYYNDTRYVGIWEMTFNGFSAVSLANELRFGGSTVVFSMTNPDFKQPDGGARIPRDTFLIRRVLSLYEDTLFETVELKNFAATPHTIEVQQWVGGRFDDVFEVRGFSRLKRGRALSTEEKICEGQRISTLQYEGLDGQVRRTHVHRFFDAEKVRVSPSLVGYFTRVEVAAKSTSILRTVVSFDKDSDCKFYGTNFAEMTVAEKMRILYRAKEKNLFSPLVIQSDNAILNRSILNAQTDIYMLLTKETENCLYPYAGIPWFSAPFGRDGIITAYQLLPWYPSVARGVLEYTFKLQGTKVDAFTEEEPGKIFHELRRGEMSNNREVPFIPYYGTVDATPLVIVLLHEYIRWTLDREFLQGVWSSALSAMEWIDKWGDMDNDGFVEYIKRSPTGLVNQGWKDSHDSIMHADGRLAEPPIRLCEVQGYVYRARMGMSVLASLLGYDDLANRFRIQALELKSLFTERFWNSGDQFIYLAIDGKLNPCAVRSSNMGHCLWSLIATAEQAEAVTRTLVSDDMFSGYGIRTLASEEASYNPLSYHNGSVWPHDNSIIMEGFRFYGHTQALEQVALGMLGVLETSDDFRLPELYCGFRKRGEEPPIPYEVACKPQAWAAGSILLMLKAMLGLSTETDQTHLVFNSPLLTSKMNRLEVKGLVGRDWEMDFVVRRTKYDTLVEVERKRGNVRVLTVK